MLISDEHFMKLALKEAERAFIEGEVPVGAIVVMQNKVIARGYNQVEKLNDCTAHAEMIALTSAFNYLGAKYLPEAAIYITVEPCLMCAGALYWSKIARIVYGAPDEKNGYRKFLARGENGSAFHPKTTLLAGVSHEACTKLMQDFFRERR
ncbi:MAG: nucleoside deaminase [Chitinophagaceae bacterium]